MPISSRTVTIDAPAARVFAYVDDFRNLARHMSGRGSMPMMGSKLAFEIVTPALTGVGATYRYSGRVLGFAIDFSESVTRYVPGREKVWRTIGQPRLLVMEGYEMRVVVEPVSANRAALTVAIDYTLPRAGIWRLLGRLLAASYASWCLDAMTRGTARDLERSGP